MGTTVAAFLTRGGVGNDFLNASCFLAFATLFPDYEFRLFLLIPVKVKWLALFTSLVYGYVLVVGPWDARGAVMAAFANYLLFFGEHLVALWRSRNLKVRQAARRVSDRV